MEPRSFGVTIPLSHIHPDSANSLMSVSAGSRHLAYRRSELQYGSPMDGIERRLIWLYWGKSNITK